MILDTDNQITGKVFGGMKIKLLNLSHSSFDFPKSQSLSFPSDQALQYAQL